MANIFIPISLNGAAEDVSAQGSTKTFEVSGSFAGAITFEASAGGGFVPIPGATFSAPGKKTLDVAAKEIRAVGGSGAPDLSVSANDEGAKFADLPIGGAPVDVSDLGTFNTVIVDGLTGGLVKVQTSEDSVNWVDCLSFQASGMKSKSFIAKFMRAQNISGAGAPVISVAANNEVSDSSAPVMDYVFRPGATGDDAPGGNVYTDFIDLMAAIESTFHNGTRRIVFDSRFSTDDVPDLGGPTCLIPAKPGGGSWDLQGCKITNYGQNGNAPGSISITSLQFQEGASFINCLYIDGSLGIDTISSSPCIFLDELEDLVITGMRVQFPRTTAAAAPHFAMSGDTGTIFIDGGQGTGWGSFAYGLTARSIIDIEAGKTFRLLVQAGFVGPDTCEGAGTMVLFLDSGLSSEFFGSVQPQTLFTGTWITLPQMVTRIQLDAPVRAADFEAFYSNLERVDTSVLAITATLPLAGPFRPGEKITIKDTTGDAATNPITVATQGAETVDGAASVEINVAFGGMVLWSDGSNWHVLSRFSAPIPAWTAHVVAAHIVALPTAGYVVAVEGDVGVATGPKAQVQNGAPAAGEVDVAYDAAGIATLTFNAVDAITNAQVVLRPL
jgi:hypothetical protein